MITQLPRNGSNARRILDAFDGQTLFAIAADRDQLQALDEAQAIIQGARDLVAVDLEAVFNGSSTPPPPGTILAHALLNDAATWVRFQAAAIEDRLGERREAY